MNYSDLDNRAIKLAHYILENQTTIRATAKEYNLPKSTVHHDLSYKLKYIDYALYLKVRKLLEENFKIKHIHGGESTKHKYELLKMENKPNENIEYLIN